MYNYKAFLLFLVYTSLFCWLCFPVAGAWVWAEIIDDSVELDEGVLVVNVIMLAVLSGIIGLVLSGFTAWHCYLAIRGRTTIESLEKTRYLSPLKKSMERQLGRHGHNSDGSDMGGRNFLEQGVESFGEQLKEIHANALPGITRPEEGTSTPLRSHTPSLNTPSQSTSTAAHPLGHTPAQASLSSSYAALERSKEKDRYSAYLDELDSEKLPHAFNLGWRRNLTLLFGDQWWLWPLPVCTTQGDGWKWEVSKEWLNRRDEIAEQRRLRDEEEEARSVRAGWGGVPQHGRPGAPNTYWDHDYNSPSGAGRHYYDTGAGTGAQQYQSHAPNHTPWAPSWTEPADNDEDDDNDLVGDDVFDDQASRDNEYARGRYLTTTNGVAAVPRLGRRSPNKADLLLGRPSGVFNDAESGFHSSLSPNDGYSEGSRSRDRSRRKSGAADEYDSSSDETEAGRRARSKKTGDWNDVPEEMFARRPKSEAGRRAKGD